MIFPHPDPLGENLAVAILAGLALVYHIMDSIVYALRYVKEGQDDS